MRRSLLSLLVLGLSTPAFAQISLDAMTTPGRHFGMGFYVTDHLSLRPSLGLGYSDYSGVVVNAGADVRYDFSPDRDWSLYATGSLFYQGGPDRSYASGTSRPRTGYADYTSYASYDGLYYGAGVGVRRRVGERLAFMLDGRYLHTATSSVSSSSLGQFRIDGQNQVVASLGLSFYLK